MTPQIDLVSATCEVMLLGLLMAGAISDLVQFKLPNWLTLATALVGVPWVILSFPLWPTATLHVLAAGLMLLIGILAFRWKVLGGGDAKWLAAIALWVGFGVDLMRFLMLTTIFGGILGLAVLVVGRIWPSYGMQDGKRHLPYGIAIALAGLDFWFRRGHLAQQLMALQAS